MQAHGLELGKLVKGNAFRVSEFGGTRYFHKDNKYRPNNTVTSTNGMYVKGGTTVTVVPEGNRPSIIGDDGKFFIEQNTDGSDEGDKILLDG